MPTNKPTKTSAATSTTTSKKQVTPAPAPTPTPPPSPPPSPQPAQDPNAALAAVAQQAVTTLDTIAAALGTDPGLTPKDKARAAKLRKGGEPIVSTIGNLAQQQQLEAPALPVATMLTLLGRADAIAPLANRLASFVALVNDIMFAAQSQAWGMALTYYALLQRRARADGKLATALEPVTEFLAYRHPSTKPSVGEPTKKQTRAARKAQKALATVAGGKLANVDLLDGTKEQAAEEAANAPAAPTAAASNGATTGSAPVVTNGAAAPAAHS